MQSDNIFEGGDRMEEIGSELMGMMGNKVAFVIPIFGGIPVSSSVVTTWGIMILLVLLSKVFVRNLELIPVGRQIYVESVVGMVYSIFEDILGEEGKRYIPYLGTVAIYLAFANLSGLVGVTPPTKDLNVTAGLAIMSIFLIEYSGIKAKGYKGWLSHFKEPTPLIAPLNVMEVMIRPLSLCMRLFGNILGGFVIMEIIKMITPAVVPVPLSLYFEVFDGLLQTYIFVFLTSLFMKEKMEH